MARVISTIRMFFIADTTFSSRKMVVFYPFPLTIDIEISIIYLIGGPDQ